MLGPFDSTAHRRPLHPEETNSPFGAGARAGHHIMSGPQVTHNMTPGRAAGRLFVPDKLPRPGPVGGLTSAALPLCAPRQTYVYFGPRMKRHNVLCRWVDGSSPRGEVPMLVGILDR